jgi:hypothetical protein
MRLVGLLSDEWVIRGRCWSGSDPFDLPEAWRPSEDAAPASLPRRRPPPCWTPLVALNPDSFAATCRHGTLCQAHETPVRCTVGAACALTSDLRRLTTPRTRPPARPPQDQGAEGPRQNGLAGIKAARPAASAATVAAATVGGRRQRRPEAAQVAPGQGREGRTGRVALVVGPLALTRRSFPS